MCVCVGGRGRRGAGGGQGGNYPRRNYPSWEFLGGNFLGVIVLDRYCREPNYPRAVIIGGSCSGGKCPR